MQRLISLLVLMFALLPSAQAFDFCQPTAAKYVHAGQQGPNWFVWWWCPDGRYQWAPIVPGEFTADHLVASATHAFGLNPSYMNEEPYHKADEPLMVDMAAAVLALATADADRPPKPTPAVWVVGKTNYPTRPTYPVVAGVRSTVSDGRATVGATCDCAKPIVEGKTTYCPVALGLAATPAPNAKSVTVCTKVP